MKKFFIVLAVLVFPLFVFSQDVYVGIGHIWEGKGDLVKNVDTASMQLQAGFVYDLSDHFYFDTSIHRDTLKVEKWLLEHNFIDTVATNYEYTIVDAGCGYVLNPKDNAKVKIGLFVSEYFSPNKDIDNKFGYGAEVKVEYSVYKDWYVYFGMKYRHTSDFIAKEVNVLETSYGVGYRFGRK